MRLVRIWILLGLVLGGSMFGAGVDARQTPVASGQPRCMGEMETQAVLVGITEDLVIVQDIYSDEIIAFELDNCDLRWWKKFRENDFIGATLGNGIVVARSMYRPEEFFDEVTDETDFYKVPMEFAAFNVADGEELWVQVSKSGYSPWFQIADGMLVVEGGGGFEVRDVRDGELAWQDAAFDSYFWGQPFVRSGIVVRFDPNGTTSSQSRYVALDLFTGQVQWELPSALGKSATFYPSDDHGTDVLLVTWTLGDAEHTQQLVTLANGTIQWPEANTSSYYRVINEGVLYELIYVETGSTELRAVSLETHETLFNRSMGGHPAPIGVSGDVVVTLDNHTGIREQLERDEYEGGTDRIILAGFDTSNGEAVWSQDVEGSEAFQGAWVLDEDDLIVATSSEMTVLNARTGYIAAVLVLPNVAGAYPLTEPGWCPTDGPPDGIKESLIISADVIVLASCESEFAVFDRP